MSEWIIKFIITKQVWDQMDIVLSDFFPALSIKPYKDEEPNGDQLVQLYFADKPDTNFITQQLTELFAVNNLTVPGLIAEALPNIDWLQHVYDTFKPIEAGRFFIHGSHMKEKPPHDMISIVIEAASAFGTGEHPTTKGCLLILDDYLQNHKPRNILDMGSGSGILSLALAKAHTETDDILGIDIHAESVRVSNSHAKDNGLDKRAKFIHGDGFHSDEVQKKSPYDLIFGNILAQPLIEMAPEFSKHCTGDLILSGFTEEQLPYVENPYIQLGFKRNKLVTLDGWIALWLTKAQ